MNFFINWQKFSACAHFIDTFSNLYYLGKIPLPLGPFPLSHLLAPLALTFNCLCFNFGFDFPALTDWLSESWKRGEVLPPKHTHTHTHTHRSHFLPFPALGIHLILLPVLFILVTFKSDFIYFYYTAKSLM